MYGCWVYPFNYEEYLKKEEEIDSLIKGFGEDEFAFDEDEFLDQLHVLMNVAYSDDEDDIRDVVSKIVPTYHPAGEHGTEEKPQAYIEQIEAMAATCK